MRRHLATLLVVLALVTPAVAHAHVRLKRSDPGAGALLGATPLDLRFWFSEPVELAITKVTLTDGHGKLMGLAPPVPSPTDPNLISLQLFSPLDSGTYKVSWETVALDGHPSKGTFTFRVLGQSESVDTAFTAAVQRAARDSAARAAHEEAAAEATRGTADVLDMRSASPPYVAARSASLIALVLVIGAIAFFLFVLQRTNDVDAAGWKKIELAIAPKASLAALVYVIVAGIRLLLQTQLVSGNDMPDVGDLGHFLLRTNWGVFWIVQVAGGLVACLSLAMIRVFHRATWTIALLGVLATALATAFTSHAGAAGNARSLQALNDLVHLLSVGAWLGGLFWLLVSGLPPLSGGERRSKRLELLVSAFSRLALICAGVVVLTGLISALLRVGTLSALVSSSYGEMLMAKLALVAIVGLIGLYNWRRVLPALASDGTVDPLRKTARAELAVALFVLVATAVLVGLPTPMH